jgi:hypothetical protein
LADGRISDHKIPIFKHQASNNLQIPNRDSFGIGYYLEFGIWSLEFVKVQN